MFNKESLTLSQDLSFALVSQTDFQFECKPFDFFRTVIWTKSSVTERYTILARKNE